ncbi:Carnitine O-acetyltransferase, mitochondrial [Wickerhamiella sorbophila]|uniref:Carnitine O-acetyltransferase, mitochondrial n=1 Tax=Wickerhamiella sorbophila TaxID=45607 RepID=A0A2T0FHG6_9ASCO|nr:Carnitine O-acetyltransferase, mitochondrial [Wickerhamiella sorbophila]PRT54443.1 Carnitine O-acetyltransferase, mitochondrial [Wickerhamiella sorbophila]
MLCKKQALSMPVKAAVRMNSTAAPAGYKEDLVLGKTYRFQNSLPKLPVPTLQETAKRYLRTVKPFVIDETYARTEKLVQEFIAPGGQGEVLQKRLEARAADPNVKNWLYEFWNEAAYMAYRDPVVPYVSYFYSYKDDPRFTQPAKRAAAIITAALKFKGLLDTKTLEPDYMRKAPIDMELFRYLFHNCRVPEPKVDGNLEYPVSGNEYFVVARRNRFYKVPYLTPEGRQLSTAEFESQLLKIYNDADLKGTGPNVGALTSENRDVWYDMRRDLLADATNAASLETIQASAFVVCLDFAYPLENVERTYQYWHGNCQNRFYDKPVQFVINDNGTAGFMGEHSMMDGTQTHRLNDYVCDEIFNNKVELTTELSFNAPAEEIVFNVSDKIAGHVARAERDFWNEIDQHEVAVWVFNNYGKNLIKQFKCSPDAYLQMLLQLAYFRMNGVVRPVYESAATRKFAQGRTETCRSVSIESADFARSFWDANVSDAEKVKKFRLAVDQQVKYIADASEGRGVDRHMFGLKKMLQEGEQMPGIFQDPVFAYSGTWYISSSQLSSEYFNGYGWSEVIPEGFGCAYMINANNLQVNICSKKMGSHKFQSYLEEAANELAKLLSAETGTKAKL